MNKRQKLVQKQFLDNEAEVLARLRSVYGQAYEDTTKKIADLDSSIAQLQEAYESVDDDSLGNLALKALGKKGQHMTPDEAKETLQSMLQSKVYQKQYQQALQKQVDGILGTMQEEAFTTVSDYLDKCYEDGFIGTMYDLQGQGIPLIMPLDQEAMVRAVQLDSKISGGLYKRMGEDVATLKKHITNEVSRGISTGMSYQQIAQQLSFKMVGTSYKTGGALARAMTIARTEGHRIQVQGGMDACYKAKEKGADVVKQWDSTLDARTRDSHVSVDGEVRELDDKFSNGLMFPGDPAGGAAQVVNCRCALLQRARWAVDDSFTKMNNITGEIESFEGPKDYAEFKEAFFSDDNMGYMRYVQQMEKKYGTKDFAKVLDQMTDEEYGHFSKLLESNPVFSKEGLHAVEETELTQTVKITKKNHVSDYGVVDRRLVNSKEFHDKFEGFSGHKKTDEALYQEAMRILEHRDGTPYEDVVIINSRTGAIVESVLDCDVIGKVKITAEQLETIRSCGDKLILLHNHPNGSRPSYADIRKLKEANIDAVVSVGHDGSLFKVYDLDDDFDIDKFYQKVYNGFKKQLSDDVLAERHATDLLYRSKKFKVERR